MWHFIPPLYPSFTLFWNLPPGFLFLISPQYCSKEDVLMIQVVVRRREGKSKALIIFFFILHLCHWLSNSSNDPQSHPVYPPSFFGPYPWFQSDLLYQICQYSSSSLIFLTLRVE